MHIQCFQDLQDYDLLESRGAVREFSLQLFYQNNIKAALFPYMYKAAY